MSFQLPNPKKFRNGLLSYTIAGLLCQSAIAATYYIAPGGNDSSSGSATAPFVTLQQGVNVARAGDTILLRDGVYGHVNAVTGGDSANYAATPVTLYYSGTSTAWITIKAEHKGSAILDCEMICDSYINLLNASYVSIEDLVITRGYKEGIHSNDAAHHITLRGNRIEYIANRNTTSTLGQDGMYTNPNCHDFIIDGNIFHDIGRTNPLSYDHGLYLRGTNFTITNNVFYNNARGWSIQLADGASNILIANNTFSGGNPNQDGQIMLWNVQNGLTIQNNIFHNPRSYAIARYASSVNSCSMDRNIVYGASGVVSDTSGCSIANSQVGANPMFVNPSGYDFHVQAGGPGVDTGATLGTVPKDFDSVNRPQGGSADVGAYEYNAPSGPVISGVFVSSIFANSAIVNWTTNTPASSYVDFGIGGYTSATAENPLLTTTHSVALINLSPSSQYQFRVGSHNSTGALTVSPGSSFNTLAVAAQFSLSASPSTVSVVRGSSASTTINASLISAIPGPAAFTASALPSGVTASFSSGSCSPGCSTTLTLSVTAGAPSGTYPITIAGNASTTTASTTVSLTITNPATSADTSSGMVGSWAFAEGNGPRAADSSGNGNTASLVKTSWSRSVCGSCIWLNGSSSTVSVRDTPSLQLTSRVTVAMWLNSGISNGTDPRIVAKLYDWDIKLNGSSRYPQFSTGGKYAMLNRSLPMGVWQHVVFTFSSGVVKGYVNGQPVAFAQNTFTGSETLPTNQYGLFFGSAGDNTSYFGGFLDDIRIYNRELTATDVAALYSQTMH